MRACGDGTSDSLIDELGQLFQEAPGWALSVSARPRPYQWFGSWVRVSGFGSKTLNPELICPHASHVYLKAGRVHAFHPVLRGQYLQHLPQGGCRMMILC
jgi:hypothetical protein